MLKKRIIPCLDVYKGRVVKGVKFVNLKDAADPVEIAGVYDKSGADELVFLDITATTEGRNITIELIKKIAEKVSIPFTVGGGIRTVDDFMDVLKAGANKVSINSAAVKTPELITQAAEKFGSECVVVAIDAGKRTDKEGWDVFINGGNINTQKDVIEWAKEVEKRGAGEILLTSMDCDGTKNGYDIDLTRAVAESVNIPVTASGGAGSINDFYEVLTKGKADAALAASLFHYKEVDIVDLKKYLKDKGVNVIL